MGGQLSIHSVVYLSNIFYVALLIYYQTDPYSVKYKIEKIQQTESLSPLSILPGCCAVHLSLKSSFP